MASETGESVWARRVAKALSERDEALVAVKFLMSQVERLAHHAFSDEVEQWLEKCDAMNCGRKVLKMK